MATFALENLTCLVTRESQSRELKANADGSVDLYIQKENPGPDRESNWLPVPKGKFILMLRLYWPKAEAPSILPPGEGSWQPPGLVKVK
jgi:hypothetical protein